MVSVPGVEIVGSSDSPVVREAEVVYHVLTVLLPEAVEFPGTGYGLVWEVSHDVVVLMELLSVVS